MLDFLWNWWYGDPTEADHILVVGSLVADIELSVAFGEDASGRIDLVSKLCSHLHRWYLVDEVGSWDRWEGPTGPMELTYHRQRIINEYGIVYRYPQVVLYNSWYGVGWSSSD